MSGYPPERHVLRDLLLWTERDAEATRSGLPVVPEIRGPGGAVERTRLDFRPTESGHVVVATRADGSTSREESSSAGPLWAETFAGALAFSRRCPPDAALYATPGGSYLKFDPHADGTATLGGFAEMMKEGYAGELGDQARDYVGAILDSVARLGILIDGVLDLTQSDAGGFPMDMAPVDLRALAEGVANENAAAMSAGALDFAIEIDGAFNFRASDFIL